MKNQLKNWIPKNSLARLAVAPMISVALFSQSSVGYQKALVNKTMQEVVASNLKFVTDNQVQQSNRIYVSGEWPTQIQSTLIPSMVGVGKLIGTNEEATGFSTAIVANVLASLYLEHPELQTSTEFQKIPMMVSHAVESFDRYKDGYLYNFYPTVPWKGTEVRQPIDMSLITPWKALTNVPADADTTSVVYSSRIYNSILKGESYTVPRQAFESLQSFRDVARKAHIYNRQHDRRLTGAFMTWQMDENSPDMPRMWFADPKEGSRIPFNRNDVDCIVNTNVLRLLALSHASNVEGRAEACNLLNDMIKKGESATCGIYYPNTFNLAYAMGVVQKAGGNCLQPERQTDLVEMILKNQSDDGAWENVGNDWVDRVQSTVFALHALLDLADSHDSRVTASIEFGTRFLLGKMQLSAKGNLYLKGETFFTATAIARSLVIWKSDAYTTALGASVLAEIAKRYPSYCPEHFGYRQ